MRQNFHASFVDLLNSVEIFPMLNHNQHVKHITEMALFHLKDISKSTASFCPTSTTVTVFLHGITPELFNVLQYIQNPASHLLTHTRCRDHITPILQNLHLAPCPIKPSTNQAPPYLTDLLYPYTPSRSLCLPFPKPSMKPGGICIAAPTWNSHPNNNHDCSDLPSVNSLLQHIYSSIKTHSVLRSLNSVL